MALEQILMLQVFLSREKQARKLLRHHYQILANWGIFTGESIKPFIVTPSEGGQPYENIFHRSDTAVTSQIEMLLSWLRDNGILISEPAEVRHYLSRHFNLTRILRSVCKLATDQFAGKAQLSLEVYSDPEIDDTYLTLYIRQARYSEDILKSIETLRAEYEVDLTNSSGWFLVTTDFRPPL